MAITAAALVPHPPLLVPEVGQGASPELEQLRSACRRALAAILDQVEALLVVGPAPSWGEADPGATGSFAPYGVPVRVRLPGPRAPAPGEPGPPRLRGPGPSPTAVAPGVPGGGEWLDRRRLPSGRLRELPLSLLVAAWLLSLEAEARQLPPVAAFGVPASMDAEQAAATGRVMAAALRSEWRAGLLVMADLSARRTAKAPAAFHPAAEEFDRRIADIVRKGEVARLLDVDPEQAAELRTGGLAALWLLAGALAGAGTLRGEVLDERAPFGVGYLVGILESR